MGPERYVLSSDRRAFDKQDETLDVLIVLRTGEMNRCLRVHTALAKDPSSIPSTALDGTHYL